MYLDRPKAIAREAAQLRRHLATRAGRWFDHLLARAGMPSAIPVADWERGTVVWFGVRYELRSSRGDVPGKERPEPSVIVRKLPSRNEIGRVIAASNALHLSFTSPKGVDQRALRHVAAAWFDGAEISAASNAAVAPAARAP